MMLAEFKELRPGFKVMIYDELHTVKWIEEMTATTDKGTYYITEIERHES